MDPRTSDEPRFTWRHVLYRLFNAKGELIYVGITNNIAQRFANHAAVQPWWAEVADCKLAFEGSRSALESAEKQAILNEAPRYNKRVPSQTPDPRPDGAPLKAPLGRTDQPRGDGALGDRSLYRPSAVDPTVYIDLWGNALRTLPGTPQWQEVLCADPASRNATGPRKGHEQCWTSGSRHCCLVFDPVELCRTCAAA